MKILSAIAKIVATLAFIAGVVCLVATYGDKIVAWAKRMLNKINSCCCCSCCEEVTPAEETPAAETTVAEPAAEKPETETTYSYTAPEGAEYHYTAQTNPANNPTQPVAEPVQTTAEYKAEKPAKSENLSTVDFIWMMLISSIPLVGLIYIIYLAIQNNNTNKRSYARATLIISLFAAIVGIVFTLGFMISGL